VVDQDTITRATDAEIFGQCVESFSMFEVRIAAAAAAACKHQAVPWLCPP
jgi:hypothetical protein